MSSHAAKIGKRSSLKSGQVTQEENIFQLDPTWGNKWGMGNPSETESHCREPRVARPPGRSNLVAFSTQTFTFPQVRTSSAREQQSDGSSRCRGLNLWQSDCCGRHKLTSQTYGRCYDVLEKAIDKLWASGKCIMRRKASNKSCCNLKTGPISMPGA